MGQVTVIGEIEGFVRTLYTAPATWGDVSLSVINNGKAEVQVTIGNIDTDLEIPRATELAKEQIERFILAAEWSLGHELRYNITKTTTDGVRISSPDFVINERLGVSDSIELEILPTSPPSVLPELPLEAKRWIQIWTEATKFHGFVEEQLRRQYLIIEELWQEHHHIFTVEQKAEKRRVKAAAKTECNA